MKKLFALLLTVCLAAFVAVGCSKGGDGKTGGETGGATKTEKRKSCFNNFSFVLISLYFQ